MSAQNIAYVDTPGLDLSVTTSTQNVALPFSSSFILVKNVGTAEAFINLGGASQVSTASATTSMSIPAGENATYRSRNNFTNISFIGAGATTLRAYPTEGI